MTGICRSQLNGVRSLPLTLERILMLAAVVLVAAMTGSGCAAVIRDKSRVNYVGDDFGPDCLCHEGLAMLPVVAGQGQEGYRRPMGEQVSIAVAAAMGEATFLDWRETMERINAADLSDTYQDLITTYRETAILQRDNVAQLGDTLGVRYLLFVSLEDFHSKTQTTYNFLSGVQTMRTSQVSAFCQVWDCGPGDVVWEGSATANSQGGEFTYDKPYEEYARVAAEGVTRRLFGAGE